MIKGVEFSGVGDVACTTTDGDHFSKPAGENSDD